MRKLVRDQEIRGPNPIIESVEKVSPAIKSGVNRVDVEWFYLNNDTLK